MSALDADDEDGGNGECDDELSSDDEEPAAQPQPSTSADAADASASPAAAIASTSDSAAASPPQHLLRGKGSPGKSSQQKSPRANPATTEEVDPTSEAEVALMADSIRKAMRETGSKTTDKMYDLAAELYLREVTIYYARGEVGAPDGLRLNRTSGARIRAVYERCIRTYRAAERERSHRGAGSPAAAEKDGEAAAMLAALAKEAEKAAEDGGGSEGAAAASDAPGAAAAATPSPETRKKRKREKRARNQAAYEGVLNICTIDQLIICVDHHISYFLILILAALAERMKNTTHTFTRSDLENSDVSIVKTTLRRLASKLELPQHALSTSILRIAIVQKMVDESMSEIVLAAPDP